MISIKRQFLMFMGFVAVFLALLVWYIKTQQTQSMFYSVENKTYRLLIADSATEWEKGLMDVKKIDTYDGMIFLFPDKEVRSFWNKNTHLNLDLYWLNDDMVVGKSFLPAIEKSGEVVTASSPKPVNKVLEIVR